jgi:hypothetical protein
MGLIMSTNYCTRRNVYHREVKNEKKLILVDSYVPKSQIKLATACYKNKNNWMPKVMLNYGPNGLRLRGRPSKRLLDEAETDPVRLNRDE